MPTLNLTRVYVLTTADTCSASESIINGLKGAGVTVNQIGVTTCGKPYGFYPQDNCGTTYFSIEFRGVNEFWASAIIPMVSRPRALLPPAQRRPTFPVAAPRMTWRTRWVIRLKSSCGWR